MARKHLCLVGQLGQFAQTVDELEHAAAVEVGAADAASEERVAREEESLALAVEGDGSWRVARRGEDQQFVVAKGDGLAVLQIATRGRKLIVQLQVEILFRLIEKRFVYIFVLLREFRRKAVGVIDRVVAKVMVEVAVSGQETDGAKLVLRDIFHQFLALVFPVGATVDDDTVARLVGDDVAVFTDHVELEAADGESAGNAILFVHRCCSFLM